MAHYNSFEELDVYKKARLLAQQIWQLIQTTGLRNDSKLRNHINASSVSVMDNITERFGRGGNKEFIHFLGIARGSCCEVKSQLLRCLDRKYLDVNSFYKFNEETKELIDQLSKFSNDLKHSDKRGNKFD